MTATASMAPPPRAPAVPACSAKFLAPCVRAIEYSLQHFLYEQASFFAERLAAEVPGDDALHLLATSYVSSGDVGRAYALLKDRRASDPRLRYLLAFCCMKLDKLEDCMKLDKVEEATAASGSSPNRASAKLEEAEAALLGYGSSNARVVSSEGSDPLGDVANGAAGLFLLGQVREKLRRWDEAMECYTKCLELSPFMWSAFERLSWLVLGAQGRAAGGSAATPSQRNSGPGASRTATPAINSTTAAAAGGRAFAASHFNEEKLAGDSTLFPENNGGDSGAGSTILGMLRKRRRNDGMGSSFDSAMDDRVASLTSPTAAGSSVNLGTSQANHVSPRRLPHRLSPSPSRSPTRGSGGGAGAANSVSSASGGGPTPLARSPLRQNPLVTATRSSSGQQAANETSLASLLQALGDALHSLHAFACPKALEVLQALPARHHDTALVRELVARCHFEMADYRLASEVYTSGGDDAAALCWPQGLEYHSTALWHLREGVELSYLSQRALQWDRRKPQVWCVQGNCFSLQREHDQAIRCFRRAIQTDPSFVYAYTLCGHEYSANEKFDKAIQMFEQAISLDTRHYNAWWGLGNVYNRQEDHHNAKYHFQKAVQINADNLVLRTSLGTVCQSLGEPERALELFAAASAKGRQCSALALFHKGQVLVTLRRLPEAIEELRRAQTLAPREPCVHFEIGRVYAQLGDAHRALLHFTIAMDLCGAKDSKDHQIMVSAQMEVLRAVNVQNQNRERDGGPRCGGDTGTADSPQRQQWARGGDVVVQTVEDGPHTLPNGVPALPNSVGTGAVGGSGRSGPAGVGPPGGTSGSGWARSSSQ